MVRASGILLPIFSLPSAFGIGDLGPESYRFVDLLVKAKQHYWSILPLSPTRLEDGNSPYQTSSAFAGNPLLISPEKLIQNQLLSTQCLNLATQPTSKVNYLSVYATKERMLDKAYSNYKKMNKPALDAQYNLDDFCSENQNWLSHYTLFTALRKTSKKPWQSWPSCIRKREPQAITKKESDLKQEIERQKFNQYLFFSQLRSLKEYCKTKQIRIVGDVPFYVTYDSADVWVHPELFSLDPTGKPRFVGGVPPDYFSATGQLWGNPTYNWQKMQKTGFEWWTDRISHNLKLYDRLRLDHFRGFVAYWQVPAASKTANTGKWVKTPSQAFFVALKQAFPQLPFIAEDLGDIDEPVRQAIMRLGIPGMKVLLFGLGSAKNNPNNPKNHIENSVVYTGTHDTNTARGWFVSEAKAKEKKNLFKLLGKKISAKDVSVELVKIALSSVANLSIVPLQDVLGLGTKARMNNPGCLEGNWEWRAMPKQVKSEMLSKLGEVTVDYKRAN